MKRMYVRYKYDNVDNVRICQVWIINKQHEMHLFHE